MPIKTGTAVKNAAEAIQSIFVESPVIYALSVVGTALQAVFWFVAV